jgi:hypothetical protein
MEKLSDQIVCCIKPNNNSAQKNVKLLKEFEKTKKGVSLENPAEIWFNYELLRGRRTPIKYERKIVNRRIYSKITNRECLTKLQKFIFKMLRNIFARNKPCPEIAFYEVKRSPMKTISKESLDGGAVSNDLIREYRGAFARKYIIEDSISEFQNYVKFTELATGVTTYSSSLYSAVVSSAEYVDNQRIQEISTKVGVNTYTLGQMSYLVERILTLESQYYKK